MKVGEIIPMDREITLNEGKPCVTLMVTNTGDRPGTGRLPLPIFLK